MQNSKVYAAEAVQAVDGDLIQARGVWHRPNVTGAETDLDGICSVLDTFKKAGINLVFLETFYHGMTVYRSSLITYYTGFDAFDYAPYPDYLSAFVAEAEKRGIEVHAWVEDFYIGVNENYFTRFLPQWLMLTRDGQIRHSEGAEYGGYLFLDPANPEVRQYLTRFYDELLTRFPQIAGLNLDYIRYPLSSQSDDTGYTEVAMNGFAQQVGMTFPENATREEKVDMVAQRYDEWVNYRADQVTTFVGEVYEMVKSDHAGVLLSTAVFPEQGKSFGDKKQDFTTWLARGYLDIITPMAYYDDIPTLQYALEGMLPDLSQCYCYAGISPTYHNLSGGQVLDQMQTAINTGADGFVFFGSQSILNNQSYIDLLEKHISGRNLPLLPHSGARVLFQATARQVETALRAAGEPEANIQGLLTQLSEMAQDADDSDSNAMERVRKQLRLLAKYNLSAYVSADNVAAVENELNLLCRWIDVKAGRLLNKADSSDDSVEPEIPLPTDPPATEPEDIQPPEPTEGSITLPTEKAVGSEAATDPTASPESPTEPEDAGKKQPHPARMLGLGVAIAAMTAAIAACFHAIRKGRKK